MLVKKIDNINVVLATFVVNRLIQDGKIADMVMARGQNFDPAYTNLSYQEIAKLLSTYGHVFNTNVEFYRTKWPWSSAKATTYTGDWSRLLLNTRALDRTLPSIAGSIAHEWGHCFEYWIKENVQKSFVFNHGKNSPVGKENTFQYWLGVEVEKIAGTFEGSLLALDTKDSIYEEITAREKDRRSNVWR